MGAAARLCLADLYSAETLKQACLAFITRSPDVLQKGQATAAFEKLVETRPKLLQDILAMSSGVKRKSSEIELEFPDTADWSRLTQPALKRACKERRLSEQGNKAALKDRLEQHCASTAT